MWRFHSFLDPKVLVQPAKEKAQGKGRVCAAAMCLRSDDESLKGAWLQWSHRVSCLGVVCLGRLLRGLILDDDVGVVKSSPWYWISSCAESLAPCDEAASSSFPLGGVQSAGRRWRLLGPLAGSVRPPRPGPAPPRRGRRRRRASPGAGGTGAAGGAAR